MILADLASRLRLATQDLPAAPQEAAPAQKLADVLSDLAPGQRIMAKIQALMPNGTYRAIVSQRDITLALPFSAKPGDSLELEVTESDGKLTLAFVANRSSSQTPASSGKESVATTLSSTGKLIGDLLGGIDQQGKRAPPAPLNGNQPLILDFPDAPAQLIPVLKNALAKSGMFYESHQALWVEGELPTAALLQEPQGKLSLREPLAAPFSSPPLATQAKEAESTGNSPKTSPLPSTDSSPASTTVTASRNPVPPDLAPLVQQQLDALATQNYVWQGQVWPGQQMHWEIEEEGNGSRRQEREPSQQWQTRLKLTLPALGEIDAVMHLRAGGEIDISLTTGSEASREKLIAAGEALSQQLDNTGLHLLAFAVQHGKVD